jgi:hypothetical protein
VPQAGDLIALMTAGAYGAVQAGTYNTPRWLPEMVLVERRELLRWFVLSMMSTLATVIRGTTLDGHLLAQSLAIACDCCKAPETAGSRSWCGTDTLTRSLAR